MVNSVEFGKRLEKIMQEHDLTASAFADRIDVGRSSISHILSGRNKPSLEFVMKVVQEFDDVELYWLLNGKGVFPAQNESVKPTAPPASFRSQEPAQPEKSESKNLPSQQKVPDDTIENSSPFGRNEKDIERIVIFYTDGTFKNFNP